MEATKLLGPLEQVHDQGPLEQGPGKSQMERAEVKPPLEQVPKPEVAGKPEPQQEAEQVPWEDSEGYSLPPWKAHQYCRRVYTQQWSPQHPSPRQVLRTKPASEMKQGKVWRKETEVPLHQSQ